MIEKEKLFNDNINIAYKIAHQYKKNYNNEFEPDRHIRVWNYLKHGYTQENIANIENISQAQVCRIRTKLLKKLKDKYDGGGNNG